ncbi:MAG: EamA family transporter [Cyanobacteria bacterium P01_H01_bin.15]
MSWVVWALLTAVVDSSRDLLSKRSLQTTDEYLVAWSSMALSLPLLWSMLFFIEIPPLPKSFWWAVAGSGVINSCATLLYVKGINRGELSLTVPLITFTPLFLLVTSPLMVGEVPDFGHTLGIVLIVGGAYLLNLRQANGGIWAPLRALLQNRGSQMILLVALLWSVAANFDRLGISRSSPTVWAIASFSTISIPLTLALVIKSQGAWGQQLRSQFWLLLAIGSLQGLMILFQMQALNLALVAQVVSIKRTSVLMTVLVGALVFKEFGLRERLLGAGLMVCGVALISF